MSHKRKLNILDFIKIVEDTHKRIKRQATEWKEIFSNHISDMKFIFGIYKKFSKCKKLAKELDT